MKEATIFFLTTFFFSCSIRETVIDTTTDKVAAGYSKKAELQIGKPFACNNATLEAGTKEGLISQCVEKTGKSSIIEFIYVINPKYVTLKGISPGDSVTKVIKIYGNPKATHLDYGIEENSFHSEYKGLFYDRLTFFVDTSFTKVNSILIGDRFSLEKKYIVK